VLRPRARQDAAGNVAGIAQRLEIVCGPRAGAKITIEPDRPVRIGHAFDDDVVIRHPSARGVAVRVSNDAGGVVLHVETGSVRLLGVTVEAGRSVRLPQWVPFAVGEAMLAVGPDRGEGWPACRRLARQLSAEGFDLEPAGAAVDAVAPSLAGPMATHGARRWWRVPALLLAPGTVALAVLLTWPGAPGVSPPAASGVAQALREILVDEGLPQLKIVQTAQGELQLKGHLERDADRVRLAQRLRAEGIAVRLDLGTGEQLARQVGDVLRLNGVTSQVRHLGRGVVEASFDDPGATRRGQLEAAVRRDVPGLSELVVHTRPGADTAARAPAMAVDAGKRVVNVVYGPRGYLVTADGARYFEGAFLPSGHRIVRIAADEVHLERDGKTTRLAI
jgi:type III secretion protein D